MTILSMLLAQQRENDRLQDRIRQLETALAEYKHMLSDALDEIARLKADSDKRGRT